MRILSGLFAVLLAIALPSIADAQYLDDFDSYANGSGIIGQGNWDGWGGDITVDGQVTSAQADTAPHSLDVSPGNSFADVVQQFAGLNSGIKYVKAQTYIPTGHAGETYFIMLNTYDGSAALYNWSLQIGLSGENNLVTSYGGTDNASSATTALILDQWVEILAEIDLDGNTYTVSYDGTPLDALPWNVSGLNEIQCIDLFCGEVTTGSGYCTTSYFDGIYVGDVVPVELQSLNVD